MTDISSADHSTASEVAPPEATAADGKAAPPSPAIEHSTAPAPLAAMATESDPAPSSPATADVATAPAAAERPSRRRVSFPDLLAKLRADAVVVPYRRPLLAGAALLVASGVGYGAGRWNSRTHLPARTESNETALGLRQAHEDAGRLGAELKALRVAVDGIRSERDRNRGELLTRQAQLAERTEKFGTETSSRIGKLGEQLERVEKTQRDPSRITSLIERLDRIEKAQSGQVAAVAAATPPSPPPKPLVAASDPVTQTGSISEPKPAAKPSAEFDPRKTPLDGFVLRDLDEGDYALVENRQGRLFEVAPGKVLPGVGRVEAIERRGRRWVVITPKGFIAER